jgi:hypothetical protein
MGDDAPEMKGLFTFRQSLHPNRRHLRERTSKTLHMAWLQAKVARVKHKRPAPRLSQVRG